MNGYQGEEIVDIAQSPFANHSPADMALYFISKYGQIDGDHHKAWVIDQCARILTGCPIIVARATWKTDDTQHEEWRVSVDDGDRYREFITEMKAGEDGPETYGYEEGITP